MTERQPPDIEAFTLGPYQTNCFIVRGPDNTGFWLADVGFDAGEMLDRAAALADQLGRLPEAIVLTHAHMDHIAGLRDARERFPHTPIWIHEAEKDWLTDADLNLSGLSPMHVTAPPADRLLTDGETLTLAGQDWRVLHTPGHSPGGIALHHGPSGVCICGDAIFNGSIGRTDFPGSSFETLAESIRSRLYTLPDDTVLLPGHGPQTSVGHEKKSNPFVPGDTQD